MKMCWFLVLGRNRHVCVWARVCMHVCLCACVCTGGKAGSNTCGGAERKVPLSVVVSHCFWDIFMLTLRTRPPLRSSVFVLEKKKSVKPSGNMDCLSKFWMRHSYNFMLKTKQKCGILVCFGEGWRCLYQNLPVILGYIVHVRKTQMYM